MTATEELVAYLDGELSAEDCRRVERRLSSDANYRRQLTELEQAWTALDTLPQTEVADEFTRTTIEMVTVAAQAEVAAQTATRSNRSRRRMYLAAGGAVLLAAATFGVARPLLPDANRALIADLPVIAQLDVLMQVGDIDFLRGLTKFDFDAAPTSESASLRPVARAADSEAWQSPAERRAWIEALSTENKAELAAKFDRFAKLTPAPEAQERLRQLVRDIDRAPDRKVLQQTLTEYAAWVHTLSPVEQMELRTMATDGRLRRVEELIERGGRPLSLADERALQDSIFAFVAERRPQFQREVERRGDSDSRRRLAERPSAMVAMFILDWNMRDDAQRRQTQDRLTARLSPEAQEYFDGLEGLQRSRQLRRWIWDALRPKFGPQNLERFFAEELDPRQREYLLGLPKEEMEERLQRLYMSSEVGLREWDWPGGPGGFERRGPGRGPWGPDRGPGNGGRRGGPRGNFERGPFPGGPGGMRPNGPPPNGPPRGNDTHSPAPANGAPPPREGDARPSEQPI